ncbi:ATP-binding cassette domain-containing protein [Enterococcus sp. AZ196]|uniref:ATP-binding cassette domain-containing protein n=1 Tax=Enterococcus sp. AZ196 TaxID=2774659 RepID=UPI003D27F184
MNTSTVALSVQELKKSYQGVCVLNNVSFAIKKGSIFSLLGSNGAGKTTTIKILTTLSQPDSGKISIYGYDPVSEPSKVHQVISLTGQFASVDGSLSGFENLVMIGQLNRVKNPKEKARKLLEYFDLTKAGDRLVSTYSGGMRRKIDIAMSLVNDPDVLFLDEPTTGLDPQSRRSMWQIIKKLKKAGTTIFLTTQYLDEAEKLADHIAILDKGGIIVDGTLADLKQAVPQGLIEFSFADIENYQKAQLLLSSYKFTLDDEQRLLIVYTDSTVETFIKILELLRSNDVQIEHFQQKDPSLEDVFLTLIGEKERVTNE